MTAFPSAPLTTNPTHGPGRPTPSLSDTTSSRTCAAWTTSVGRLTRIPRLVVRRKSFEWCILSNRGNTVVAQTRLSGGQTGAALAAPRGNNGAACACPHPQTKAVGTAATAIARLECALAHGKTPTIFGVLDNQVRCSRGTHHRAERTGGSGRLKRPSNGTGHCQTGQTGPNLGGLRNSGRRCPVDTPNIVANIRDSLAPQGRDC
jgi:hypothetical protein